MARAVCGPNGASRPLPPLPRHTVARPRIRSTSSTSRPVTSPARIPVLAISPHDGLVAAVAEVLTGARLDQPAQLVVGQRVGDFGVELGGFQSEQRVLVNLAFLGQPRREPAHTELAGPGGGRFGAGVEQIGHEPLHQVAVQGGGVTVFVTPAQERSNAVPVALDGLRRLALGAQRQLPRRQRSGQIESGWLATRHPDISTGYAVVVYYFWIDR